MHRLLMYSFWLQFQFSSSTPEKPNNVIMTTSAIPTVPKKSFLSWRRIALLAKKYTVNMRMHVKMCEYYLCSSSCSGFIRT